MKRHRILLAPQAEKDIAAIFWYIHEDSPLNAEKWLHGMYAAIDSLRFMPERCGVHSRVIGV